MTVTKSSQPLDKNFHHILAERLARRPPKREILEAGVFAMEETKKKPVKKTTINHPILEAVFLRVLQMNQQGLDKLLDQYGTSRDATLDVSNTNSK